LVGETRKKREESIGKKGERGVESDVRTCIEKLEKKIEGPEKNSSTQAMLSKR